MVKLKFSLMKKVSAELAANLAALISFIPLSSKKFPLNLHTMEPHG